MPSSPAARPAGSRWRFATTWDGRSRWPWPPGSSRSRPERCLSRRRRGAARVAAPPPRGGGPGPRGPPPGSLYILQPHSIEIELLSERGIVGLGLFAAFVASLLAAVVRTPARASSAAGLGVTIGLLAQASFDWTRSFVGIVAPPLAAAGGAAGGERGAPPPP